MAIGVGANAIITERPYQALARVWHGEDWFDPIPQMVDPITKKPFDISDVLIEVIARPSPNHSTRFISLSSGSAGGVIKDDPVLGLASIFLAQVDVEADLPISPTTGWWHMQRLRFTDPELGDVIKILAEGPLIVYPARQAAG